MCLFSVCIRIRHLSYQQQCKHKLCGGVLRAHQYYVPMIIYTYIDGWIDITFFSRAYHSKAPPDTECVRYYMYVYVCVYTTENLWVYTWIELNLFFIVTITQRAIGDLIIMILAFLRPIHVFSLRFCTKITFQMWSIKCRRYRNSDFIFNSFINTKTTM